MDLPQAFAAQMAELLGGEWEAFRDSLADTPPVSVRWHPVKAPSAAPGDNPVPWCPEGQYLAERPVFTLDPRYHAGAYYVQEASSMLLEAVLADSGLSGPVAALDLCAAPGGKSTHLLGLLSPDSLLVSNEIHPQRYQVLLENGARWGYPNQAFSRSAPRDLARAWPERFGLIVVDAPCSGEGLFRKDPGAVAHWSPEAIRKCVDRQREILQHAIDLLAPGGVMLYSTCTYNRQENEEQMDWLQAGYPMEPIALSLPESWGVRHADPGWRCFPHLLRGEGFYCCALRKTDSTISADQHRTNPVFRRSGPSMSATAQRLIASYLAEPDRFLLEQSEGETWQAIPADLQATHADLLGSRAILQYGIAMGGFKTAERFVPDHRLALSVALSGDVPAWELDREAALAYLRKDPVPAALPSPGLYLVRHAGLGLGWANVLRDRVNNLIPHHWRIRLAGSPE